MKRKEPRLTVNGLKVLKLFADNPTAEFSGADIAVATHMLSGTLYPLLIRYEQVGWLKSRWESEEPQELGRPRRRLYLLTAAGGHAYSKQIEAVAPRGNLSWAM